MVNGRIDGAGYNCDSSSQRQAPVPVRIGESMEWGTDELRMAGWTR